MILSARARASTSAAASSVAIATAAPVASWSADPAKGPGVAQRRGKHEYGNGK